MKRTLPLLCALLCAASIFAQTPNCVRDSTVLMTGALLSPAPWDTAKMEYNLKDACISHPYNQSVTFNVPTTFQSIPITNVTVATTGAVLNLPIGLTYACDPPNCVFNAGTLGCIVLYGTPTVANTAPDTLDLGIKVTVNSLLGPIPLTFPNTGLPNVPEQHYYLALKTAECLVGTFEQGNQFTLLKNAPNPFGNQTLITAESLIAGEFRFEVFDLLGQRVHTQTLRLEVGTNEFTFDAGDLANGAYFYSLGNRDGKAVRRMVIAR